MANRPNKISARIGQVEYEKLKELKGKQVSHLVHSWPPESDADVIECAIEYFHKAVFAKSG